MRYAYEAILPVLLLVGAAGVWVWRRSRPAVRSLLVGLLACELCSFAAITRRLIPDWHNDETMRRATLAEFPNSEEANRALATELRSRRPSHTTRRLYESNPILSWLKRTWRERELFS